MDEGSLKEKKKVGVNKSSAKNEDKVKEQSKEHLIATNAFNRSGSVSSGIRCRRFCPNLWRTMILTRQLSFSGFAVKTQT